MNRTILITGASSGFGLETAKRFATEGDRLVLVARREDKLRALVSELSAQVPCHTVTLDVQNRDEVFEKLGSLPNEFSEIDVLVNNAGLALGLSPVQEGDVDDWERMIDTNIKGLIYVTRAVLPGMIKRGRGHVINIGSTAGSIPYPGGNVYGGTKAFVEQFTKNLHCDVHGTGVRVTNIAPGLAETEFSVVRFKGDTAAAKKVYEGTQPLTAEDIAESVVWVTNQPAHVNVNLVEMMPTCQSWGMFRVKRE